MRRWQNPKLIAPGEPGKIHNTCPLCGETSLTTTTTDMSWEETRIPCAACKEMEVKVPGILAWMLKVVDRAREVTMEEAREEFASRPSPYDD